MPERRLPISAPAAAGTHRHIRRPRRRYRRLLLLLLPLFALALFSLAYPSHRDLPFHVVHHGLVKRENVGKGMDQRYTQNAMLKKNISMSKVEAEPSRSRKKSRKHYAPCQIEFLPSVDNLLESAHYNDFAQFSLNYIFKEEVVGNEFSEPLFGGHQNLKEREETYYAKDQTLHCGFVKGPEGYPSTGFDLDENDKIYMATCRVVVSSCIFGRSDYLRRPTKSKMGSYSKKNVCFTMFLDELTLATLSFKGHVPDENGFIGLWRIIIVKNLPYKDMRRAGKVPKFLAQRLFPSALYSIWLDSKLRLHADPLLVIEYFLLRKKTEYAISMHYDRTCVWEEVLQNKCLNKYNHTAIDKQFYFYQSDGLVKFKESGQEPILPSYVPEGSFIVRAHTPMSNFFHAFGSMRSTASPLVIS